MHNECDETGTVAIWMAVKAVNTETYVIQDTKGMFEWDHSLKGPFNTVGLDKFWLQYRLQKWEHKQ